MAEQSVDTEPGAAALHRHRADLARLGGVGVLAFNLMVIVTISTRRSP